MNFSYRAFGLDIRSSLRLPEYSEIARSETSADIEIRVSQGPPIDSGEAPHWTDITRLGDWVVIPVEDVADFWVRGGQEIVVCPLADADPGLLRLYLAGSAMGMALWQRGELTLHASGIVHDGWATVFLADSGVGKSTTAALLGMHGCQVLADDVLCITSDPDAGARAWPGSRLFKLWADSMQALGLSSRELESVANRTDKFYVENWARPAERAFPVRRLVVLTRNPLEDTPQAQALTQLQALQAISNNVYRREYVDVLGGQDRLFKQCAELAGRVPAVRLNLGGGALNHNMLDYKRVTDIVLGLIH